MPNPTWKSYYLPISVVTSQDSIPGSRMSGTLDYGVSSLCCTYIFLILQLSVRYCEVDSFILICWIVFKGFHCFCCHHLRRRRHFCKFSFKTFFSFQIQLNFKAWVRCIEIFWQFLFQSLAYFRSQRIYRIHFVRGSITVRQTSCLSGLDLTKQVNRLLIHTT